MANDLIETDLFRSKLNPSRWGPRILICCIAGIAVLIASYMGLYEWQLIDSVYDPVFGDETEKVLDSHVSHVLRILMRIPDSAMGAVAYLGDILFALGGSIRRWHDRPWLVMIFGFNVVPVGIVSATLVFMQGKVVGSWCFPCLITASISLILIYLAYDEIQLSIRYLHRVWKISRDKKLLWNTFWGRASEIAFDVTESVMKERETKRKKNVGQGH